MTNQNSVQPTFNATTDGVYVLQLVAAQGQASSAPVLLNLEVRNALAPAPSTIVFANIKAVLQGPCVGCHVAGGGPPVFFNNIDRDGNGTIGDAVDDQWFYAEVRGLINFTAIDHSPLLRKPTGLHHGGGRQTGFDTRRPLTDPLRATEAANYDLFVNWILNGAPQ